MGSDLCQAEGFFDRPSGSKKLPGAAACEAQGSVSEAVKLS